MDLFIAGLSRAGTTMLANLLTTPPARWVIVEPGITRAGGMTEMVREQAEGFGLRVSEKEWGGKEQTPRIASLIVGVADAGESAEEKFERVFGERVKGLERWGVKEVNPEGWDRLIERHEPRRVVLAVRDVREAAASAHEKWRKDARAEQTEEWLRARMVNTARALVGLWERLGRGGGCDVRVVRYEEFVREAREREAISQWLDWPMDGDPRRGLEGFGRGEEAAMHGGEVTDRSARRKRAKEATGEAREFVEGVARDCGEYQRVFGYVRVGVGNCAASGKPVR